MIDKLTGSSKILEKSLDAAWLRNEVISQNIANADTPGYKRKTVDFEQYLSDAMDNSSFKGNMTDSRHIPIGGSDVDSVNIEVRQDNSNLSTRLDGNNVDIESEMASLAKNELRYNTLVQSLSAGYNRLISAIKEGR